MMWWAQGAKAHGKDPSSSFGMLKKDFRRGDLPRVLEVEWKLASWRGGGWVWCASSITCRSQSLDWIIEWRNGDRWGWRERKESISWRALSAWVRKLRPCPAGNGNSLSVFKKAGSVGRCACEMEHSSFSVDRKLEKEPEKRQDNQPVMGPLQCLRPELRW